jgi:hypothetical protein
VIVSLLGFNYGWAGDLIATITYIPTVGSPVSADLFHLPGVTPPGVDAGNPCSNVNPIGFCANFGGNLIDVNNHGGNYTFDPTSPNNLWATVVFNGLGDSDQIFDCASPGFPPPCGFNAAGTYFPTTANSNAPYYTLSDFSVFNGADLGGTWQLSITNIDPNPPSDPFPSFIGWELDLTVDTVPEPSYTLVFALLGAVFLVKRLGRKRLHG